MISVLHQFHVEIFPEGQQANIIYDKTLIELGGFDAKYLLAGDVN